MRWLDLVSLVNDYFGDTIIKERLTEDINSKGFICPSDEEKVVLFLRGIFEELVFTDKELQEVRLRLLNILNMNWRELPFEGNPIHAGKEAEEDERLHEQDRLENYGIAEQHGEM